MKKLFYTALMMMFIMSFTCCNNSGVDSEDENSGSSEPAPVVVPASHSITYLNVKGATIPNDKKSYLESEDVTLPTITSECYQFSGWHEVIGDVTQDAVTAGWIKGDRTTDLVFWAYWSPNTYSITFDANGGTGTMDAMDMTYDVAAALAANGFTKEGSEFLGWNTNKDAKTILYADKYSVKNLTLAANGSVTLYAIWGQNLEINGESIAKTTFVKVMDDPVIIDGTDDNWSSYLNSESGNKTYNRGVFIDKRPKVKLSPYYISKYEVTRTLFEKVMGISFSDVCESVYVYQNNKVKEEYGNEYYIYHFRESDITPYNVSGEYAMSLVSWYDAIAFCNKLSLKNGKTLCYSVKVNGVEIDWEHLSYTDIPREETTDWNNAVVDITVNGYRLPTEAEWEFAARGGDQSAPDWKYAFASAQSTDYIYEPQDSYRKASGSAYLKSEDALDDYAWYGFEYQEWTDNCPQAYPVGMKSANRLGIYDMSGNMYEWCWDNFQKAEQNDAAYKVGDLIVNPLGAEPSVYGHVYRGGAMNTDAGHCAVSYRQMGSPYPRSFTMGFRLAQTVTE